MYSYLFFGLALLCIFSIFENLKSGQKISLFKINIILLLVVCLFANTLDFLSELGIVGFVVFFGLFFYIIFKKIINFFKINNYLVLASTLYVLVVFIPLLPSGSFFVSFGATIFWINFSFMVNNFNE